MSQGTTYSAVLLILCRRRQVLRFAPCLSVHLLTCRDLAPIMYVFKAHLPTRAMDTLTLLYLLWKMEMLQHPTFSYSPSSTNCITYFILRSDLRLSSRGQTKPTIAARQPPLHSYVLRSLATTADRRKASLIYRFTTERLWLYSSTRPI